MRTQSRLPLRSSPESSSARQQVRTAQRLLCVDMDGTVLATDTLWESLLVLVKSHPWLLFLLPLWLCGGRAAFKRQIAQRVQPDISLFPYRKEVLAFLAEEKNSGREIVLASAADEKIAADVAAHLGLFSAVLASNGTLNLSGRRKLDAIERHAAGNEFDYIGDSLADLPIWSRAHKAMLVSPSARLFKRVAAAAPVGRVFRSERNTLRRLMKALRVNQWSKNLLIFVPLIVGHKITDLHMVSNALWAFLAFCLCASSAYVLNDLMDLEADRRHPRKRNRPFAAGDLGIALGLTLVPVLWLLSFATAGLFASFRFSIALFIYFAITLAYSFWIKRIVILDVLTLAGLYTIRVLAGGAATGIPISPWLLAFSAFLFLSLALVKRYAELRLVRSVSGLEVSGRDYNVGDLQLLSSIGPASGLISILVLALYINSPEVVLLYRSPLTLWLIGPLLLYWITRLWLLAHRDSIIDDPLVFTARDPISYVVGILILGVIACASFF